MFHVSPALLSGGHCYGPRVKVGDAEEFFCVMGVWKTDGSGMPVFDKTVLPTVVYEFCHSYSNPLVARHFDELKPAGQRIFPEVASRMVSQAYGSWETMMYESFVRASVVRYLMANDEPGVADREIREQEDRGFLWTRDLVKLLDTYEANRDTYPTLEDFMPKITAFFDTWADTHITEE